MFLTSAVDRGKWSASCTSCLIFWWKSPGTQRENDG